MMVISGRREKKKQNNNSKTTKATLLIIILILFLLRKGGCESLDSWYVLACTWHVDKCHRWYAALIFSCKLANIHSCCLLMPQCAIPEVARLSLTSCVVHRKWWMRHQQGPSRTQPSPLNRTTTRLVGQSVGWLASWLVVWLTGMLVGWLLGWLVMWLVSYLVGWLVR